MKPIKFEENTFYNTAEFQKTMPKLLSKWQNKGFYLTIYSKFQVFVIDTSFKNNKFYDQVLSSETLLIFHGFPTSSFDYYHALPYLEQFFKRIMIVDFIGFGFSDKPSAYSYSLFEQADIILEVWK